jgi:hypothetical protein
MKDIDNKEIVLSPDKKPKHPGGRPSLYTDELANRICEIVAINPCGLPTLCKQFDELPTPDTIRRWRWDKPEFSAKYTEAKRFQAEIMVESLEEITQNLEQYKYEDKDGAIRLDAGLIGHARLITDTRKWTASKLAPKIYGDRQEVEALSSENAQIKEELKALRAQLAEQNKAEY